MSIDFMVETIWFSVVISRVATGFTFTSDAYPSIACCCIFLDFLWLLLSVREVLMSAALHSLMNTETLHLAQIRMVWRLLFSWILSQPVAAVPIQ